MLIGLCVVSLLMSSIAIYMATRSGLDGHDGAPGPRGLRGERGPAGVPGKCGKGK